MAVSTKLKKTQRTARSKRAAPRPRHRAGTERDLIGAVGAVLSETGVAGLSLSLVARHAGVDKALVYRYFGSFEALVDAYVRHSIYWPSASDLAHDRDALLAMPFGERFVSVMTRYARALRERPATIDILGAELGAPAGFQHVFQQALEERRERFGLELLKLAYDAPRGLDVPALASLATGGIHYLLIRARQVAEFNGIALASDAGWRRIELGLEALLRGVVEAAGWGRTPKFPPTRH